MEAFVIGGGEVGGFFPPLNTHAARSFFSLPFPCAAFFLLSLEGGRGTRERRVRVRTMEAFVVGGVLTSVYRPAS